jgi:hypothetical protein
VDGDGVSEFAVSVMDGNGVRVRVYDGNFIQVGSFTVNANSRFYGTGAVDTDEDDLDQLMLGRVPETADQIQLRDALTGVLEGGFDAFPSLIGTVTVAGG